jgi:hypothetical protein
MKKNITVSIIITILSAIGFFLLLGFVSAIVSNPFFSRMTSIASFNWFVLVITSIFAGTYVGLYNFIKNHETISVSCATGGGVLGFLAFACPVCNKLIILVLGFSGAMTYFAPIQPFLGILGIGLLLYANFVLIKKIKNGNIKKHKK